MGCPTDDCIPEECESGICEDGVCAEPSEFSCGYGWAGIGINNGWTCDDVCAEVGGPSLDWNDVDEQVDYCQWLNPGAVVFYETYNYSYPIYTPQDHGCFVNLDGSGNNSGFTGSGTDEYGDQIHCKCDVFCP
jgi:hypothetical protein